MTWRQKLLHTNIYDLLCRMQINLDNLLPSVECNFCVLDLVVVDTDAYCDGGRGITICEEWNDFSNFKEWANENGYSENLTLDRIDNNGNYESSNCRWVTMKEQQNNKRNRHFLEYAGERHTITEWAEKTGISKTTLRMRIQSGWTVEEALTKPIRLRKKGWRKSRRYNSSAFMRGDADENS